MSFSDEKQRAAILRAIAVGERSADDPEVRDWCERDAGFRSELEEFQRVITTVSRAAELEREVLADTAEWADGDPAPGEELVEATLRRLAAEPPARRTEDPDASGTPGPGVNRPMGLIALFLAAAAALLVYCSIPPDSDDPKLPRKPDLILGSDSIVLMSPVGNVEDLPTFHWEFDLSSGSSFELIIRDPQTGQELYSVERLNVSQWQPPTPIPDDWPDEIEWEVSAVNYVGEVESVSERVRVSIARSE